MENTTDISKPPSKKPRLIAACVGGNYRIAKTIIQRGDDVNVRDANGATPLMAACVSGNVEVVELLLSRGADANTQDNKGFTSLMLTSQCGHIDVVKTLKDKGADVNKQCNDGWSSLIIASENGHIDVVKILLDEGANVNMQSNDGWTSLIKASQNGHINVVKTLLDKSADVNKQGKDGTSSLIIASENGHNDVVKILLDKGADVNMQGNNNGSSSLLIASRFGHNDIVETLLDKGADVNMQGNNGLSSLLIASQSGHSDVVKTLLDKGADVNMQVKDGASSLMLANLHPDNDLHKSLFKSAAINMPTIDGWTSLMFASWDGHTDTARVLLDNHADITIQSADGHTALDIAISRKQEDIVELLADAEQDSPLADLAQPLESIINSTSQTDEQYKDVTNPDTISQGALDEGELSPVHNQDEESRDPLKNSSEPNTLGASNIIPEDCDILTGHTSAIQQEPSIKASLNTALTTNDLKDIYKELYDARTKWKDIGLELKVDTETLQAISRPEKDYGDCLKEMLHFRLKSTSDALTWKLIIECLRSKIVARHDIANETERRLNEGELSPVHKQEKTNKLGSGYQDTMSTATQSSTPEDSSIEQISRDLVLFKMEAIGSGAFGTVFRGEINGQPCALKILHSLAGEIQLSLPIAGQAKQDSVIKFRKECEYLESFKHLNVVRHLATRTHPDTGHLVLALELMDCNLRQFFSSPSGRDLPFLTQKSLCRDIASALAYIHSRHIVHRDLCSDNILLDFKGETSIAKVCDFGMSTLTTIDGKSTSLQALGHRGYLPPEATEVTSSRFDSSYDIFSFGAIIVQIVRHFPTIKDHKERTYELDQIDSTHPLKSIIDQCLLVTRDDRPSAIQLERKLT